MLAPGGGLTGLVSYLQAWRDMDVPLDVTVYASRQPVLDAVEAADPKSTALPFCVNENRLRFFWLRHRKLGRMIDQSGAQVVLPTNSLAGETTTPQIVHHQNLNCFTPFNFKEELQAGGLQRALKSYGIRKAGQKALKESAANLFISDYMRKLAEQFSPESISRNSVVHNGVTPELLESASKPHTWQKSPTISAVTSDNPHKDNPTLIRMFGELCRQAPETPWQLKVAGRGSYAAEKQLAEELGVADRIDWLGFLSVDSMEDLFRESLCLVFTSAVEGFGNPPLEAMARSCPVVASDATAIPEVCGNAALLVPVGDASGFADAVLKYWCQPQLREEKVVLGRKRILEFKWSNSAEKMYSVICDVAGPPQ